VGHFELVPGDVGQGTAVILRTREHVLLCGTGPQYSPESDASARVLLPLLRARGDERVDRLVLSHRDTDHVGGAASLLRELPIAELSSSLEPSHPLLLQAMARKLGVQPCAVGQSWVRDGVRFEMMHPSDSDFTPDTRPNAVSCVLEVAGRERQRLAHWRHRARAGEPAPA
jgi:competence protein ComEC